MANQLGAVIKPDDPDPQICKSFDLPYLVVLFDPPHMIKLVRNVLASFKFLRLESETISWHFFEELFKVQIESGLHLDNKLSKGQDMYIGNLMNKRCHTSIQSERGQSLRLP